MTTTIGHSSSEQEIDLLTAFCLAWESNFKDYIVLPMSVRKKDPGNHLSNADLLSRSAFLFYTSPVS